MLQAFRRATRQRTRRLGQLRLGHGTVSLSDIEKTLEGSPFSIKREQLEYTGILQFKIGKITDHQKLIGALANLDGKKLDTQTVKYKDGSLLISLYDPAQSSNPLITHQRLTRYLSKNKINLIAISWGSHLPCGATFGARPVAAAVVQK